MGMLAFFLMFWFQEDRLAREDSKQTKVWKLQSQIKTLDLDLQRLETRLKASNQSSRRLSDEIGRIELNRAVVSARIDKHELELAEASQQLSINEEKQQELETLSRQQQDRIRIRVRQLYKRGSLGYAQIFLKQSRLTELINAYHYSQILTKRDNAALINYRETLANLEKVKQVLTHIQVRAEETRDNLARQEAEFKKVLNRRNRRLRQIRKETSKQSQLFKELELEKEEFRLMVRRLTEGNYNPLELRVPISRYKGRLSWPIKNGSLERRFGIIRDPEFGTQRKQNGIDVKLPKGDEIRCVYSGRVIYADWFKNYGNLIIVDHNEKIISFYAHCDKLFVNKMDVVERDELIATSGDTGSLDGPMLHFEIREQTKPVDPLSWLKRKSFKKRGRKRR